MLPPDDSGYGFDNIGDVLSTSPMLLERYLSAASRISRLTVGETKLRPTSKVYHIPQAMMQDERMSEELPFGSRGGRVIRHYFPLDAEYDIQVRLQRNRGGIIIGISRPKQVDVRLDGEPVALFPVGGEAPETSEDSVMEAYARRADDHLEVRVFVKAGLHRLAISFIKDTLKVEGVRDRENDRAFFEGLGEVSISGPYEARGPGETASRKRIFICRPESAEQEEACAERILSRIARRAFRRPVTGGDVKNLLIPYHSGKKQSGFENGIRLALQRILVSPEFLFRVERDPDGIEPGQAYPLSDLELASRLSFFLWSSIPDEELLQLAERGELRDPAVLDRQVSRLLADPRSAALVSSFVGQWLYLRNMEHVLPDPVSFPNFDENLREALIRETELFFASIMRENRSILDILSADFTFLNERLARHYGIGGIYGSQFRRVVLRDEARLGLLGKGSVLTVTSYANRTSPTIRGKWVLENLLGSPPPPPPPDVLSLKEEKASVARSMRERLEQHRANPACASCHARMDPLGFALENFDGLGRWRETSGAARKSIDASGVLPDGTTFDGPAGLRKVVLGKKDQFVHAFIERMLTYAMGRGVEPYDLPIVRRIVRQGAASDYRWPAIISGIVQSMPFQMRRSREP